jgi:hypothetical protein
MGIDVYSLPFLLELKNRGYSFESTMTLGRQAFGPMSHGTMCKILHAHGFAAVTEAQSRDFLQQEDGYVEPLLRFLGAQRIESIDFAGYENATIIHDMNQPIPDSLKEAFTCVLDGGCLEHIFNFPQAIKNSMEMVKVGGAFLAIAPANNFFGHGFYQFSPELYYRVFSTHNGFEVKEMILCELDPDAPRYRVKDPAILGHRINLANSIPTYLMLIAIKTATMEIFASTPQQSDYAPLWRAEVKLERPVEVQRGAWKSLVPYSTRKFVRRFRPSRNPFSGEGFERIDP